MKLYMIFIFMAVVGCLCIGACHSEADNKTGSLNENTEHSFSEKDTAVQVFKALARSDFRKGKLKYYYSGIANASGKNIRFFRDSLQIDLISVSDSRNKEYTAYNTVTDSIVKVRKGKSAVQYLQ